MPLGLGGTLTDQEAWDVATFIMVSGKLRPSGRGGKETVLTLLPCSC
jgi:cytochrome c